MDRDDPDGVEISRTDAFEGLQVVVAVVDEVFGVVVELQEGQPLRDDVHVFAEVLGRRRGQARWRRRWRWRGSKPGAGPMEHLVLNLRSVG